MKLPHLLAGVLLGLGSSVAQTGWFTDATRGATPIIEEPRPPLLRNANSALVPSR